jgi:hypothetical protein
MLCQMILTAAKEIIHVLMPNMFNHFTKSAVMKCICQIINNNLSIFYVINSSLYVGVVLTNLLSYQP